MAIQFIDAALVLFCQQIVVTDAHKSQISSTILEHLKIISKCMEVQLHEYSIEKENKIIVTPSSSQNSVIFDIILTSVRNIGI